MILMFDYFSKEGFVNNASWLIVYNYTYNEIELAKSKANENQRYLQKCNDHILTTTHEFVHFSHSVSTKFLYSYSWNLFRLLFKLIFTIKNCNSIREIDLSNYRERLVNFQEILTVSNGVRTIDIIEGCAVFSSFRTVYPELTHDDFVKYLETIHRNQGIYTNAYHFLTDSIDCLAFDFFSVICFLSLQYKTPSFAFVEIIKQLPKNIDKLSKLGNSIDKIRDKARTNSLVSCQASIDG